MNEYQKYITGIISKGLLCDKYKEQLDKSYSKLAIFKLLCDANGSYFLPEMAKKGIETPYHDIATFFSNYINGQYIASYGKSNYTSKMYCNVKDTKNDILADTTIVSLLNCSANVLVPTGKFSRIIIDQHCSINLTLEPNAYALVELYNGSILNCNLDNKNLKINNL